MDKITLGDTVRDRISGMQGIAVGDTKWLYQSGRRITVQPQGIDRDGVPLPNRVFDEEQLEVVTPAGEE